MKVQRSCYFTSSETVMHLLTLKSSLPVNMQFKLLNIKIQSLIKYTTKHPTLLFLAHRTVLN